MAVGGGRRGRGNQRSLLLFFFFHHRPISPTNPPNPPDPPTPGRDDPEKVDQPSVIIGKGRLGKALAEWGGFAGNSTEEGKTVGDVLVGRGEALPSVLYGRGKGEAYEEFPIYVCVPEWEVEEVILACPKERWADLVFMQTACMEPLLTRYGLRHQKTTQVRSSLRGGEVWGLVVGPLAFPREPLLA